MSVNFQETLIEKPVIYEDYNNLITRGEGVGNNNHGVNNNQEVRKDLESDKALYEPIRQGQWQ